MNIVSSKRNKNDCGTTFYHEVSGKPLCQLDAKLTRDDWEQIQALIGMVYRTGVTDGSVQRATEIRQALGIEEVL